MTAAQNTISDYLVIASTAMNPRQGGVALLWEEDNQDFEAEAIWVLSPSLLTFQLVTGDL
jgi:hypothetical protein